MQLPERQGPFKFGGFPHRLYSYDFGEGRDDVFHDLDAKNGLPYVSAIGLVREGTLRSVMEDAREKRRPHTLYLVYFYFKDPNMAVLPTWCCSAFYFEAEVKTFFQYFTMYAVQTA